MFRSVCTLLLLSSSLVAEAGTRQAQMRNTVRVVDVAELHNPAFNTDSNGGVAINSRELAKLQLSLDALGAQISINPEYRSITVEF